MGTLARLGIFILALSALPLLATGRLKGAEPAKAAQASSALDKQISDAARTVINTGADLYNREGDRAGCYRLYLGALLALRPLLTSHPDLQTAIDAALAESERMPAVARRAFALNTVLQDVHKKLKPAVADRSAGEKNPVTALWQRLGGEAVVRRAVDEFVALAATDVKVNFSRHGKLKFTDVQLADLKNKLVALISQATGGPLKYTGKSMKEAHPGLGITNAEFDAALADLRKALEGQGVKPAEVHDLLAIVETTRKDIVEVNKPAEKKPDENKGADKSKGN